MRIVAPSRVYTVLSVFAVEPARQSELCDQLVEATETLVRHLPGFISTSLHLSHDGGEVMTYAQWESAEHFRAMHADPRLEEYVRFCRAVSTPRSIPCEVSYVCEARLAD